MRTETVTQEEFDTMKRLGLIRDDGKLSSEGKQTVFGQLPQEDIEYKVGEIDNINPVVEEPKQ